jgi:hypothetical protein
MGASWVSRRRARSRPRPTGPARARDLAPGRTARALRRRARRPAWCAHPAISADAPPRRPQHPRGDRPARGRLGERELCETGERVERPETVFLRALHLEGDASFSLGLVEVTAPQSEHQQLVPLARFPPRPARLTRHFRASSGQFDRAFDVAVVERELPEQPVIRRLGEGEPALGQRERVLAQLAHGVPLLSTPGRHREHLLDDRHSPVVAELPVELDALSGELRSLPVVAGEVRRATEHAERARAELQGDVASAVEEAPDTLEADLRAGAFQRFWSPTASSSPELGSVSSSQSSAARRSSRSASASPTSASP